MKIELGDLAELLAMICVTVFVGWHFGGQYALIPAAVCLVYLAQDLSQVHLPTPPRPRLPELKVHLLDRRKGAE